MSLVYEATLQVDVGIAPAFQQWLGEHIHHMLALPGFAGARPMRVDDPTTTGDAVF